MNAYVVADNIISPLGFTSEENFNCLKQKQTGIRLQNNPLLSTEPVFAAIINNEKLNTEFKKLNSNEDFTRLEKMMILSVAGALKQNSAIDITSPKTLIIVSTTKGNVDLLDKEERKMFDKKRLYLSETANVIAGYFKNPNPPLVVSNACISGVVAIIVAKRLLEHNQYDTVVIVGGDTISHFVVSGFQSFKAISNQIAKPYDTARDGISLGEGCGTIVLTNNESTIQNSKSKIQVLGGAISNDANHISGPSRTGDGLLIAIEKTLKEANVKPSEIDYISGHGTATLFNDDMESLAVADAKLSAVPMNSLKSYFGHTLGAAGIIESIVGICSMKENTLIGTFNFDEAGVAAAVTIVKETTKATITTCLKTSAGFGGCNAAVLFKKTENETVN